MIQYVDFSQAVFHEEVDRLQEATISYKLFHNP